MSVEQQSRLGIDILDSPRLVDLTPFEFVAVF